MSAIPFLVGAVVGITSALLTILLTPSLQHYFWTRQRHAERQLAAIDEANNLAAEVQFLLLSGEDIAPRAEKLSILLARIAANVNALFSKEGSEAFEVLNKAIGVATLQLSPGKTLAQRNELSELLIKAQNHALKTLYQEMDIPAPPLKQWMRDHVWQPVRGQVWDRPQRSLRQWLVTGTTRLRQSQERARRRRLGNDRPPGDV
jgi:hypothetical protein